MQLLGKDKIGQPYEIWLREGVTPHHYGFTSIPARRSIRDENVKPIKAVCSWTSNYNDAGRILRRMVKVCTDHEKWLNTDSKDGKKSTDKPTTSESAKTSSTSQTPGIA